MVILDIFSGAGGLSEGFHNNDFKIISQIEKDKWACETLKTRLIFNFLKKENDLNTYYEYLMSSSDYKLIDESRIKVLKKYPELERMIDSTILNKKFGNPQNDKEATSLKDIISLIDNSMKYNNENSIDLIIGGPPCQSYSLVGRSRLKDLADKDSRNYLFYYYLNLVREYRPKVFVFENVPGILTANKGELFLKIREEFERIGYRLMSGEAESDKSNIIDFSEFGVIQKRKRVILFGVRKGLNIKYPNFQENKITWEHDLNTYNLLNDLPPLNPGEGHDHIPIPYHKDNNNDLSDYQKFIREDSIGVLNHKAREVQGRDREIYRLSINLANEGDQLKYPDLPKELKSHKNEKSFVDRFKVHSYNKTPHTVVAHIAKDGHYNIHPDINQCRSLSVREAARIQGFPDNFKFEGPRTAQYVQVGNAVPPIMSKVIAESVKGVIKNI